GVVDQAVVPPGLEHPAQIVVSEGYAEVFGAFIPRRIDNDVVRVDAPGVRHRVHGNPSVDRVTLHVHVDVRLPKRKCRGVAEAFARSPHPDSAWQCSVFKWTAILEDEVGFAGVRIAALAGHGLAAESVRPGFEELAGGPLRSRLVVAEIAHPRCRFSDR